MWRSSFLVMLLARRRLEYGSHHHVLSNKNRLINRIPELLHDKVYSFKSPGAATVLMHKQKVSNLFQSVNSNGDKNDILLH